MKYIPMEQWGRDHWSLLAYIETRVIDYDGELERARLRCNPETHRHLADPRYLSLRWQDEYSTRLRDGSQATGHDDWDCLEDMEEAGLLIIVSLVNSLVVFTDEGIKMALLLMEYKIRGGQFQAFSEWREEGVHEP